MRRNRWPGKAQAAASSTNCASVSLPPVQDRQPLWRICRPTGGTTPVPWRSEQDDAGLERSGEQRGGLDEAFRQPLLARLFSAPGLMPMTGGKVQGLESFLADAAASPAPWRRMARQAAARAGFRRGAEVRVVEALVARDFAGTRRRDAAVSRNPRPSRRYPMRCGMPARRATSAASKELGSRMARRSGAGAERGPDPAGREGARARCTRRRKAPEHKGRRPRTRQMARCALGLRSLMARSAAGTGRHRRPNWRRTRMLDQATSLV